MNCLVYITAPDKKTALKISHDLVSKKLIACANIFPDITSVYEWKGKIEEESEVILLAKTKKSLFQEVVKAVEAIHPYDIPCVVSLPLESGNEKYLKWIESATR